MRSSTLFAAAGAVGANMAAKASAEAGTVHTDLSLPAGTSQQPGRYHGNAELSVPLADAPRASGLKSQTWTGLSLLCRVSEAGSGWH